MNSQCLFQSFHVHYFHVSIILILILIVDCLMHTPRHTIMKHPSCLTIRKSESRKWFSYFRSYNFIFKKLIQLSSIESTRFQFYRLHLAYILFFTLMTIQEMDPEEPLFHVKLSKKNFLTVKSNSKSVRVVVRRRRTFIR